MSGPSDARTRGPGPWSSIDPNAQVALGVLFFAFVASLCLWAGGNLAALLTDEPLVGLGGGLGVIVRALTEGGPTALWPGVPELLLWASIALTSTVLVGSSAWFWIAARRRLGGGADGFASPDQLASFTERERTRSAAELRRGLTPDQITERDIGLRLGRILSGRRSTTVWAGLEDTLISIMPPRSGKTTALAVPQVINAPGPAVVTSNKADLLGTTRAQRERDGSRVWVFDPQQVAFEDRSWSWNPLAGLNTYEAAQNLASMFIPNRGDGDNRNAYFTDRGREYLTLLILAAAQSERPTLTDLDRWLDQNRNVEPSLILNGAGPQFEQYARALGKMIEEQSAETIEGVYSTARTATACLKSQSIMRWVTPSRGDVSFQPDRFVTSTDTLYLLSREDQISAAPLTAALVDRIFTAARLEAERSVGGRLDPPLVAILDEAANIVKIPTLPANYSYFGSLGILVHAIFQSMAQIRDVWGRSGADKLWGASTVKLIGPGIDDAQLASETAKFIGHHDVTTRSVSHSAKMGSNVQIGAAREPIWDEARVRSFAKGQALLFGTGIPAALIELEPWFEGPLRYQLEADLEAFDQHRRIQANEHVRSGNHG